MEARDRKPGAGDDVQGGQAITRTILVHHSLQGDGAFYDRWEEELTIRKADQSIARRALLTKVEECVAAFGFDSRLSEQSFYRKSTTGKWAFHVAFIPHTHEFDVTEDVAVRIDAIEELVNEYNTKLTEREKLASMTLGVELGNLSLGRQFRWTVANSNDISVICGEMIKTFESVGLPFLQSHSDIVTAHRVLRSEGLKDTLLCPLLGPRAMRAIASGFLLDKTRNLTALAHQFDEKMAAKDDLYLEDYRALYRGILAKQS